MAGGGTTTGAGRGPVSRGRNVFYGCIIVCSAVMLYLLLVLNMRFFLVPSRSMESTLLPADYILTFSDKTYPRGRIVVLDDPTAPGDYLVKRVVALAGDTVSVDGGALFIDGAYISEPYILEPMAYDLEPFTVPEGQVFVLGDNRNFSADSHNWNLEQDAPPRVKAVSVDSIVGSVRCVYLPFDRIRRVSHYPMTDHLRMFD